MIGALINHSGDQLKVKEWGEIDLATEERWISSIDYLTSMEMSSFAYVERSYRRWRKALELANGRKMAPYSRELNTAMIEVVGATMDWLGAMRTYVDHNTTRASRSNDLEMLDFFRSLCSHQYDTRFGYRFATRLRNYAQHLGIPIHELQVNTGFLVLDRDVLLEKFNGWSTLAAELRESPDHIPLVPAIEEAMEGLRVIDRSVYTRLRSDTEETLKDAKEFQSLFLTTFPGHSPVQLIKPVDGWKSGERVRLTLIPFWVIDSADQRLVISS